MQILFCCLLLVQLQVVIFVIMYFAGEAILPMDVGILDNYRVKKQLLHSW